MAKKAHEIEKVFKTVFLLILFLDFLSKSSAWMFGHNKTSKAYNLNSFWRKKRTNSNLKNSVTPQRENPHNLEMQLFQKINKK